MPEQSPVYGLPYADPDDYATDFPVEVDGPRTLQIDAILEGKVSKAGDTMTGNLTMGGAEGSYQGLYWTASGRWISADPTYLNGDIAICDGNLTPAPLWVGALDIYGADDSTVRLRASGGQVEVVNTAGTAVAPVAHENATYGNQSMTLAQKAAFQHFAPRPADDDPVAVLRGIVAAGFTAESLEAAGVEMIRDTDGEAVGFHHERLLALLVEAVARTADGAR